MAVLVSEGGGASLPFSSKANQLPNELSIVRSWKSLNFSPSARSFLPLVRGQPGVEVLGVVEAVQRGPFVLNALDRAEELGPAKAFELLSSWLMSVLPGEEVVDVVRVDAVGHDDGHQRVRSAACRR